MNKAKKVKVAGAKFYLSTAISYVNAAPHIGHALEFIQADAFCRYHRLKGDDAFFLTGTDEHGVKIYEAAQAAGMETQDFVDQNAQKYTALKDLLNLSNDDFVRTSSAMHKAGARKIWSRMVEAGDIYKGVYKGNYCVGCESFIPEKDLDAEGNCPIHKKKPKQLEEENYFFRLSKYSDKIRALIESDKLLIFPGSRKKEMLNLIGEKGPSEGLKDVSFSRPKAVLPWGVDVPDDDGQVMYVWCDALSNYITAIGYEKEGAKFKKYWPCDVHLIGKDILRFHAGIWIGMLLSAGLKIPRAIYVHGFVTSQGQKMSKSIGNVVNPLEYVEKYGTDSLRYYLLREIPTMDDGDFSHQRFVDLYNSELANSLGNLVNRVTMMVDRYFGGKVPKATEGDAISQQVHDFMDKYVQAFENFNIKGACETLVELTDFANKYIDDRKPWAVARENPAGLAEILYDLLELLRYIATMLLPILPTAAEAIVLQLGLGADKLGLDKKWGMMKEGLPVKVAEPLFPRIEEK